MKYKSKYNYEGRYAVLHTSGLKSDKERKDAAERYAVPREHEFIAILPLDLFLDLFRTASCVEDMLRKKGEEVLTAWRQQNKSARMVGKRRPVGMSWNLCNCQWKSGKGRQQETSIWCLQISTFNYTINHQQDPQPDITMLDLKVEL
jgi:hypothetical protein